MYGALLDKKRFEFDNMIGNSLLFFPLQAWQEHGFATEWTKEAGLDVRGLRFAKDVRRQLEGIAGPHGSHLLGQLSLVHFWDMFVLILSLSIHC